MDYRNDPNNQVPNDDNPYGNTQNSNTPYGNNQNNYNPYGNEQNNNPYGNSQSNYNPYGNGQNGYTYQPYRPYQPEPKNTFAVVAMVLGLCSLLSLCTFFLPLPLGALSIVFVILSRRQGRKMTGPAMAGLVTSLVSIAVGIVFFVSIMGTAFTMLKPENREQLNEQFESIYGMDFNEYMERFYGEDFDDMMDQIEEQMR